MTVLTEQDVEEMEPSEVVQEVEDALSSIEAKKDELLDEKKTWQEKAEQRQDELDQLETRVNELEEEAATKEGDIEKVKQQIKEQKEKELEQERQEKQKFRKSLESQLIDRELTEALSDAGVAGPYLQPLRSQLRDDIEVVEGDDGEFEAVASNGAMNRSVEEHVNEFLDEQGREHYTQAPANSGGGAGGSGGSGGTGTSDNPLDRSSGDFNMTEAANFIRNNDDETINQKLQEAQEPVDYDDSVAAV